MQIANCSETKLPNHQRIEARTWMISQLLQGCHIPLPHESKCFNSQPIHTYLFIPIHTYSYLFIPIHTYSTLKSLEMPWRHISKLGFSRHSGYGDFWMGEWSKVFGPPWIIEYDRDLIMIVTVVTCRATCRVVVSPCAVLSGPPPPPPPPPAPVGIAGKAPVIAGLGAMPPVLLVQLIPRCSNLFRGVPRSSINQDSHNQTEINKHKIHGGKQMSWCHIEIIKTYIYIYINVNVSICMYIYIYIHT